LVTDAPLDARTESAIPPSRAQSPTEADDTFGPFPLPSICQKKVTAAFDGGQISSDGGVLLLAGADRRLGLTDTLTAIIPDHLNPADFAEPGLFFRMGTPPLMVDILPEISGMAFDAA
jgi:hypothetical protein